MRCALKQRLLVAGGIAGAILATASVAPGGAPLLPVNESPSVPVGLYAREGEGLLKLGSLVTIAPPSSVRGYLASLGFPRELPLLKRVAATAGEHVCAEPGWLQTPRARVEVRSLDRSGHPLPAWHGCRSLAADELLLLGDSAESFDGRYFGPVKLSSVEASYREVIRW